MINDFIKLDSSKIKFCSSFFLLSKLFLSCLNVAGPENQTKQIQC